MAKEEKKHGHVDPSTAGMAPTPPIEMPPSDPSEKTSSDEEVPPHGEPEHIEFLGETLTAEEVAAAETVHKQTMR